MERKTLLKSKLAVVLTMFTVFSIVLMVFVLAKYIDSPNVAGDVNLEDFDVELVYIGDYTVDSTGSGVITLTPEQYKAFSLSVEKTGKGWAYARVVIDVSWVKQETTTEDGSAVTTGTVVISEAGTLQTAVGIKENTDTDGSTRYYVNKRLEDPETEPVKVIDTGTAYNAIPNDIATDIANSATYVAKLSIKVEAVQYNRIKTLWDIEPIGADYLF